MLSAPVHEVHMQLEGRLAAIGVWVREAYTAPGPIGCPAGCEGGTALVHASHHRSTNTYIRPSRVHEHTVVYAGEYTASRHHAHPEKATGGRHDVTREAQNGAARLGLGLGLEQFFERLGLGLGFGAVRVWGSTAGARAAAQNGAARLGLGLGLGAARLGLELQWTQRDEAVCMWGTCLVRDGESHPAVVLLGAIPIVLARVGT